MAKDDAMISEVADGVMMLTRAAVNCYLVDSDDGPILIDAGLPGSWRILERALASVRRTPGDLRHVYLTHAHFDHVGMAARLADEHGTATHAHAADVALARHPYRYAHEAPRFAYPFRYPGAIPVLTRMAMAGALNVPGVVAHGDIQPGRPLSAGLVAIATPGHTRGHVAFSLPGTGVLFTGDALVTLDPYTARTGPRIVARAATADSAAALRSADAIAGVDARLLLPGHGAPYVGSPRDAVAEAGAHGVD